MLLQGVIDCLIETRDGFVILDFKTDRIKKGGAVERAEQYLSLIHIYRRSNSRVRIFRATGQPPCGLPMTTIRMMSASKTRRRSGAAEDR